MLTKLGGFLYRARWGVLLISLLLLPGMGIFGVNVFGLLKNGGYSNPDSESAQAEHILDTKLGGTTPDAIILMRSSTLKANDPAFAKAAQDLLTSLKKRAEVNSLISYYS